MAAKKSRAAPAEQIAVRQSMAVETYPPLCPSPAGPAGDLFRKNADCWVKPSNDAEQCQAIALHTIDSERGLRLPGSNSPSTKCRRASFRAGGDPWQRFVCLKAIDSL